MEIFEKKQQLRQDINESVRVVVRCRPMSEKETTSGYNSIVDCYLDRGVVEITNPNPAKDVRQPKKAFTFDAVYDGCSLQAEIYEETVRPLVSSVLNGFNGTIFAYGQTGTGKTYTMEGIRSDPMQRGIIPNSFEQIFSYISRSSNGDQYLVRASYMEIYKEEIRDLLSKDQNQKLELREKSGIGVYVKDLTSFVCKNIREIEHVMIRGNKNRKIGATNMNEHSSRSHTIFLITVETSTHTEHRKLFRVGKLNLVDLAGSEKQSKTGSRGERLREASKINLSLSALANVISALVDGKATHIPYRDSKLTRILQDSLGGNAKTIMIANIGPASYNYEESLTTLRYASRAKNIKNKPRINEDPKDALLREYQEEIQRLKDLLAKKTAKQLEAMKINADDESYFGDEASVKYGSPNKTDYDSSDDTPNKMRYDDQEHEMQKPKRDKQSVREELEKRRKQLEDDKRFSDMLEAKIHSMESRLLCGGKNIVDHTNEQQRALEQHKIEIAERKKREIEMKQQLEAQEESCLEIRGTYTNLQQEVEIKTRKLKKLFGRLQAVKQEIHDVADEFNRDRRELELAQNELLKELKAKYLIIENFIPTDEKVKLTSRLRYDEEQDAWVMTCVEKQIQESTYQRPVSGEMVRRPTSDYSRVAMHLGRHSRYRGEDILNVEMDTHVRTTSDYQGPLIAPKIQAVLEEALRDDEIIDVDAAPLNVAYSSRTRSARREKEKEKGHKLTKTSCSNPASPSYEVCCTTSQTKLANKETVNEHKYKSAVERHNERWKNFKAIKEAQSFEIGAKLKVDTGLQTLKAVTIARRNCGQIGNSSNIPSRSPPPVSPPVFPKARGLVPK